MSLTLAPQDPHDIAPAGEELAPEDRAALAQAWRQLEGVSFAARLTGLLGRKIETAGGFLPERVRALAGRATTAALRAAMRAALRSLRKGQADSSPRFHRALATAAGAAGGAFGLASLPVELPLSTVILLRAIADIARAEGEDLSQPEAALACLEVFALGGRAPEDNYVDSSYFAVRTLLARSISEASRFVALTAAADEAAPVMVRFLSQIGARFGVAVTQKFAAQAIPVIGAAGGAAVNYAFLDHFQSLAHGHFTVRRLERKYGSELVKKTYEQLHLFDEQHKF